VARKKVCVIRMSGEDSPAAEGDRMGRFPGPNRLYGREGAVASLLEAYDRICRGQGEIVLVPGSSGVGKTSLVLEIRGPVRERNGFFLQGKFNQYQGNTPYFAIRQALTELAHELQSEDESLRLQWRAELRHAVGELGRLLVDLAPELDSLLGPQPPVAEISPVEARHRFAGVLRSFLDAVCRPEHPVVLFLDDWQWADTASMELLKQLQVGTTLRYLLVIASYRDNEVGPAHPLAATLEDLARQPVRVGVIEVSSLGVEDVRAWVTDLLRPAAHDPGALAELIHDRTHGNPFFTQSSLAFLHDFGLLYLDESRACWHWKAESAGALGLTDDVSELFRHRLRRLDPASQDLLTRAACLGNRFDVESVSVISRRAPDECRILLIALPDLVVPVEPGHRGASAPGEEPPAWFVFVHDRVQQAAYSLVPPADLPAMRLEIGRLLRARLAPEQLAERVFEVADHMNAGRLLVDDPAERVRAMELNVAAARKAWAATAYRAALEFHRAAGGFAAEPGLRDRLWGSHPALALAMFREWAESEFLEGDRVEAERLIEQAVAHARTPVEKAQALDTLIVHHTLRARYPEAIAAGRQALAALGIVLPEDDYESARADEVGRVRKFLEGRSIASLAGLPVMSDPEMCMAARILITMGPPCYRSHQRLWGVIVPKVVNLTLLHGNLPQVGYSHTAFGGLLCWDSSDFESARAFGDLATRLMTEVFQSPSDRSVYALMMGSSVRHWFHHLSRGSADYAEACEIGLQSGNLQYTAYAFGHDMYCRFYQGAALAGLIQESQSSLAFSRTRTNQWAIDLLEGGLRIFTALAASPEESPGAEELPEAEFLAGVEAHQNIQVTCIYRILKAFSLMVLGRHREALEVSDQGASILYTVGMQGLLPWPEHVFSRLLILTALAPDDAAALNADTREELERMLGQLRLWATHCPENFGHKYHLAQAELARLDHRSADAMGLYEQAIDGARTAGFVQWEGVANERAARFWLGLGNGRLGQVYLRQAYGCFERWGAGAKLELLETEYAGWLAADLPGLADPADATATQVRGALLEKQLRLLRGAGRHEAEARMRGEVERQAEELARATERLRAEVAERKRIEEELRLHRVQLEERVSQRTAALEASLEERRRGEAALAEGQKMFRTLVENSPDVIARYDRECRRIYVNPGYLEISRVPHERLLGTSPGEVSPLSRGGALALLDVLRRVLDGGAAEAVDVPWPHPDGVEHWYSIYASPESDQQGHIASVMTISRDITERRRAERALVESHALLNAVVEGTSDMVFVKDLEGRYRLINSAGARLMGRSVADVIGRNDEELLGPEVAGMIVGSDQKVLDAGNSQAFEETLTTSGVTRSFLVTKGVHRDSTGKAIGLVGISRDITEKKLLEEQFRQAQRMEAVGRLAGGVAHDFNNLLTVINGYSELVFGELHHDDPNRATLAEIRKAGERAATLTRQLLAFSRKQLLQPRVIGLNGRLSDLLNMLHRLIGEDIELTLIPGADPDLVNVDPGQFEQVIINLAVNARDAMPRGGRLIIETHNVELDAVSAVRHADARPGHYVLVIVSDTGEGMDQATRARIFEPFFTTKEQGKGTGLGLAMVYGFVNQSGGHLEVFSEAGRGSTFRVYLPRVAAADPVGAAPAEAPEVTAGTETVLLVEDEDAVRALSRVVLQASGYQVIEARNGIDAIRLAEGYAGPIDMLVTDLVMPQVGGRQLADHLLRVMPGMRVLFISGYTDETVLSEGGLAVGLAFLQKPFRPIELVRRVRATLDA
jgi:PAS domain S-box-containing protein